MEHTFATAINCIDGRVQESVIGFVKREIVADYVDLVTEPGPDKILSENKQANIIESIKNRVTISLEKDQSKTVVVVGHYDCAANSVDVGEHHKQIKEAVETIKSWNFEVSVYGIWVGRDWQASFIKGLQRDKI